MSKAREILDERLAKGEISIEEYAKLTEKIGRVDQRNPKPIEPRPETQSNASPDSSKGGFWWKFAGGCVIVYLAITFLLGSVGSGGLEVNNPSASDTGVGFTNVRFTLVNNSSTQGDALFWVRLHGNRICPHLIPMAPNQRRNITFRCNSIRNGDDFFIVSSWPAQNASLARAAQRLSGN